MIPLLFLVLSSGFVITLIQSVLKLVEFEWDKEGKNGPRILDIFKMPILFLFLFILFVWLGIPFLEGK